MKKVWGLLLPILLIGNTIDAAYKQSSIKTTTKKYYSKKEVIEFAQVLFYVSQIVMGLIIAENAAQAAIEFQCIHDQRIAIGGFALMASSLLYHGCKGIYDLGHENMPKHIEKNPIEKIEITPGTISKKFLKILYHSAEIFMGSGFLYGCGNNLGDCLLTSSVATMLLANGVSGINEELSISTYVQRIIDRIKKKQNNKEAYHGK
jgi:hypothetical protein